ncbi:MAG: ABC transporter ATP-binding protein [Acidimicrobiales bacterium]
MTTIELRGVTKVHGTALAPVVAVAPTDLTIADGEFFVLIGPSGCGKTTLLRIIAGIEHPTRGDVVLDGQVVNDVGARGRDVAMIFQSSALYPNLTVAENIGFSLRLAKTKRRVIAQRVHEVASMVSVDHLLDRFPRQLSGGEGQRVAMARTLIRNPHLFLMDEPMSQLDAKLRTELRAELVRVQRQVGVTTVYVTHDQTEAMSMGHRIAVMRRGAVVQFGTPEQLYREPVDLFVAQFLGAPPMNAWVATAHARDGVLELRWGAHRLVLDEPAAVRHGGAHTLDGREVVIGVRPDAFVVDEQGPIVVSPGFAEQIGPHQLVHATLAASSVRAVDDGYVRSDDHLAALVVAAPSGYELDPWRALHLDVDLDRLMLFDPADGRRLTSDSLAVSSPV